MPRSCLHFVRFDSLHGQRFQNAVRVFGRPDFLHRHWDCRALREIAAGDVIVFAEGEADQPFVTFSGDDEAYARTAACYARGFLNTKQESNAT